MHYWPKSNCKVRYKFTNLVELSGVIESGFLLPKRIDEIHLFIILVLLILHNEHIEILKRDQTVLLNSVSAGQNTLSRSKVEK